jgi:hypothetical protein
MSVLYSKHTGHAFGALAATIPDAPLSVIGLGPLEVPYVPERPPPPPPPPPLSFDMLTFTGDELAVAVLETEFADPLKVFGWRVVTTDTPSGKQRSLERLVTSGVTATRTTATELTVQVDRLGPVGQRLFLPIDVRTAAGRVSAVRLEFRQADTTASIPVSVPAAVPTGSLIVLAEGYKPRIPP